jgi:uncharacterized protein YdhG (YjbR/CyaY superfamily)
VTSIAARAGAAWINARVKPPAVVHLENSSPFIAPSRVRMLHVQFMGGSYAVCRRHARSNHAPWEDGRMAIPRSVDAYLAGLPEDQRAVLETIRKAITAAAPGATEVISYQMPAYKLDGRFLVSFAAFKNHCSLFPASGAVREVLGKELEPYFSGKGTLRFTVDKPIPAALVKKIVKTRIEENAAAKR